MHQRKRQEEAKESRQRKGKSETNSLVEDKGDDAEVAKLSGWRCLIIDNPYDRHARWRLFGGDRLVAWGERVSSLLFLLFFFFLAPQPVGLLDSGTIRREGKGRRTEVKKEKKEEDEMDPELR